MGAGPLVLADDAVAALRPERVERIALRSAPASETGACFDLNRQVARTVATARKREALPVVITGNCHTQQAVVAGLGVDALTLVWLDCHADFHTPDTTQSGFFDGSALAMTVGDCWTALCASVPGFTPLAAERVLLAGARDVDPGERGRLEASGVVVLGPADAHRLASLLPPSARVSLHVDLDVLDPAYGRANRHATAPGLTPDELLAIVRDVTAAAGLAAVTLSAYDPAFDDAATVRSAALDILELLARSPGARTRLSAGDAHDVG